MTSLAQLIEKFDPQVGFTPPTNWLQGRTIFGGLSAALALKTATDQMPDLPALRSAQIAFVGPAATGLTYSPTLLRQGKSTAFISVDCEAEGDVALRAGLLFARPRASTIAHDFSSPIKVGPPDDYAVAVGLSQGPAFLSNFEMRFAGGSPPVSGAENPEFIVWVRHKDAAGVDPTVALLTMADSLPPAAMACFTEMAPVSSMVWTFDLPHPVQKNEWYLLRSASRYASDGYSFQTMQIWDEQHRLVLSGSQTVAVFA